MLNNARSLVTIIIMLTIPSLSQALVIIGHRGASGYEPENTLRSFKRAIDMGVSAIEVDVHLCKSGEIVVIHDATINRTTNGTGNIKELNWSEIKKYDAGQGEHIPLLSEVFDLVAQRVPIIIEIKDPDALKPVATLINSYVAKKKWSYENFIVASFNHHTIAAFRSCCPKVKTGVLFEGNPVGYADIAKRAKADYAMIYYDSITKEFIANAHAQNIKIFAYTVNSTSLAHKLNNLQVDGIFTDYPDILTKNHEQA